MKLHEVVRGVEVKIGYYTDKVLVNDYNSLASAEVVVDREKIVEPYLWEVYNAGIRARQNGRKENEMARNFLEEKGEAIATAIESGSIISLKEEK